MESSATADAKPARGVASKAPAGGLAVHPCTECGKRFWSWKALFGHMRCHPERQWRGIKPPPNFQRPAPLSTPEPRPEPSVSQVGEEEEEVARSLVMLSTTSSSSGAAAGAGSQAPVLDDRLLLSLSMDPPQPSCRFMFCTCNHDFRSRQALDRHRDVKGCYVRHGENENGEKMVEGVDHDRMMKIMSHHECSMCLRAFPTGQALGRRKRCHWGGNEQQRQCLDQQQSTIGKNYVPDLNLPVPDDMEESCSHGLDLDLKLGGGSEVGESGLDHMASFS